MPDSCDRVKQQHSGACPAHHDAYALFHYGFVAVNGTVFARWLVVAKPTTLQSGVCIAKQFGALGAQMGVAFFVSTIQAYHLLYDVLLFLYVVFHGIVVMQNYIFLLLGACFGALLVVEAGAEAW